MNRRVVQFVLHGSSTLTAPVTEILDAEVDWLGGLTVWCEVDDDLPTTERTFFLLRAGDSVPLVEMPTRINVSTLGGDEQWIDGPPLMVPPRFVRRCNGPLFLYESVR